MLQIHWISAQRPSQPFVHCMLSLTWVFPSRHCSATKELREVENNNKTRLQWQPGIIQNLKLHPLGQNSHSQNTAEVHITPTKSIQMSCVKICLFKSFTWVTFEIFSYENMTEERTRSNKSWKHALSHDHDIPRPFGIGWFFSSLSTQQSSHPT